MKPELNITKLKENFINLKSSMPIKPSHNYETNNIREKMRQERIIKAIIDNSDSEWYKPLR